jgi:O-antigen/teichoic acid export membrane protein
MLQRIQYLPNVLITSLKKYFERLKPGSFFMNVTVLASSTAIGQVIVILVTPILTRLFDPNDFGIMAAYASVISIISVIAALRYDFVIPLPDSDDEAANVVALAFVSLLFITLLTIIFIIAFGSITSAWLQTPGLKNYLWLLPIGVVAVGTYQILNFWAIRKQQFNTLAKTRVSQMVGRALAQTISGFLKFGAGGLIVGYILGLSGGIGTLTKLMWGEARDSFNKVSVSGMSHSATRYRRFPLINSWSALINSSSQELPVLIISSLFGTTVVGWFYLSLRVLRVPFNVIGQAIAQVFYSRASEASRGGNLPHVTYQVFDQLVRVSLGPLLWLGLMSPSLFALIFGSDWEPSGYYSRWISPWLFLLFLTTPLSAIVYVKERQRPELIFQIVLLIARISVLYLASTYGNASTAIISFSLISTVILSFYLFWLMSTSGNSIQSVFYSLSKELLINVVVVIPIVISLILGFNTYILIGLSVLSLGVMGVRIIKQFGKIK